MAFTVAARASSKIENKARMQDNMANSQIKLEKAENETGIANHDLVPWALRGMISGPAGILA